MTWTRDSRRTVASLKRDGWVHTGDVGCLDSDGYLTFPGRFKEMIEVSGYNVFPEEVEAIPDKPLAIAATAVIGARVRPAARQ